MQPRLASAPAPTLVEKQAVRLQRYALGAFTYVIATLVIGAAVAFKFMAAGPALALACAMLAVNAGLFAAFRSGLNLRFKDPSLTKAQVYAGITLLMFAVYHTDGQRGVAVGLSFVIFLFGVFRLTTREFVTLTLYTLAAYGLVINLLLHRRPESVPSVEHEWFNWLLLAVALPWYAAVGGWISGLRTRLRARTRELEDAIGTIHSMATRDEVTGLYSRPFFTESLRHALLQAARHERGVALFFIDADRFKIINDTLGHGAGDRVLRELGARVRSAVRESDIVGRLGGDEFVVLVESTAAPEALREVAQKIVRAASQPLLLDGRELPLSVSVGVAVAPGDGRDEQELMRNADIAMYRAKAQGRNSFAFYARQMGENADERLALEAELARAAERGELRLYLQPKVRIADGAISGAEALLRWEHPRLGLLEPDRFIPIAEEAGSIVSLGRWVLERACRAAAGWSTQLGKPLSVAVNLSARQFADPSLLEDIDRALAAAGLPGELLELEITESVVMPEPERSAAVMHALRGRGVRLSMDDFGTGYSSLGYLKRFPLDTVKMDRSFVSDLPHGGDDAAIARAVLGMAHGLHLEVVAEGVERQDQLDFLRSEGCHEYQGYYCSRPVPEDQFPHLLRTHSPG